MAIHIPPDMIPRMDWNAEDKQAAWAFYRERLEQYFVIAGTPREARVTHILFYGGKEASERLTALKDQVEGNKDEADTVFKAFANSFEKAPVIGRPGTSTCLTSSRTRTKPWLN